MHLEKRRPLYVVLLVALLIAASLPSLAQETEPGDACAVAGHFRMTGGVENPDGHFVVCNGGAWQPILGYSSAGNRVMLGSAGLAAAPLHVWGEAIIRQSGLSCTPTAEGAIRYLSNGDPPWEYCDGSVWSPFKQPRCQDDDTGECYLHPTRYNDDPEFVAANIAHSVNILGVNGAFGCNAPTSGLISHWKFDESSGAVAANSAGGSQGDLNGNPVWEPSNGMIGGSLKLDGAGDYVQVDSPALPTGDFTYAYFLTAPSPDKALWMASDGTGANELGLFRDIVSDRFKLHMNDVIVWDIVNYPLTGEWMHVALTRSGSDVTLYVNGSPFVTATEGNALSFSTCPLLIGADADTGPCIGSLGNYLDGNIDDFRIYDRALSTQEVNDLFVSGINGCGGTGGALCTAPSDCTSIGDVCDDGSLFAGFMLYNNATCEPLYVTDDNQSINAQWKTTTGTDDISPDNWIDGRLNHANRGGTLSDFPVFDLCESNTYHGKADWYLPARNELNLLFENKAAIDVNAAGSFTANGYWSSTEDPNNDKPWGQNFTDGGSNADFPQNIAADVRCVRRD